IFLFLIGSMMLPGHVTLIVNYITIGNLGWLNTHIGLFLPGIGSAFAMFLLYQHMRTIDPAMLQAAEVDGAGHMRRLFQIVVPLSGPMILTATLIVLIGKWNEYVWPLISTTTANMRTLPIGLLFLRSQEGYTNWGALLAGTVIAAAPMMIIFFLAQKRIIGGLGAGAAGLGLAACGAPGGGGADADGPVRDGFRQADVDVPSEYSDRTPILFWAPFTGNNFEAVQHQFKRFNESQDEIVAIAESQG